MKSEEIRKRFLEFFEERGHKTVPSSSLVPENDPSVLFTTAGMQQFKPYYIGKKDPLKDFGTKNTVSIQKCVRTSDIEEVGDERHLTFFEMLGNFSFGGYWKEEAIKYAHEFITKKMGLKIDYVSVFEGREGVPADTESEEIWRSLDSNMEIKKCGMEDNFWGPTGDEGPCGPTTEIYVDGIEVWNIVFNEFYQSKDKTLKELDIKGIDTGMGLERLALVSQFPGQTGDKAVFETDLFVSIMKVIDESTASDDFRSKRIIADHIRTAVFMISDGVRPSNSETGYVLRRLLRRALYHFNSIGASVTLSILIEPVLGVYKNTEYKFDFESIQAVILEEQARFRVTIAVGQKQFEKFAKNGQIDGKEAFLLFSTYGFPFELTLELAEENKIKIDKNGFESEMKKHQEISKAGMEQKFKGGLGGHSEMEVKYHTATHLLHQALRNVLGSHVEQRGSNITPERLRFDFSHPQKMTDEEKKKVEDIVNQKILENLPVQKIVLPREEAEKSGALHFFGEKYGNEVSIYFVGENLENAYSKEFCGGPHVERTGDLVKPINPSTYPTSSLQADSGSKFSILKEEAVAAGVRRIKAVLE